MRGRNSSFQNLEDAKATLNLVFRSFTGNCLMFCLELLKTVKSLFFSRGREETDSFFSLSRRGRDKGKSKGLGESILFMNN